MPIVLKSSDGQVFLMKEAEAQQSTLIKNVTEKYCIKTCIPIPNVTGKILSRVIDYCRKHVKTADGDDNEALRKFDSEFVDVNEVTLIRLGKAARFLEIGSLYSLIHGALAEKMKGKSVEEICETFMVEKPEEDEFGKWSRMRTLRNKFV